MPELKESIAKEYPLGEKIVILHRSLFKNVENLRQYVEITLNHDYQINADEKQMIVDCFKQYTNSDGKIITSIF
jgi:predicted nucleic-acid-binding protein